MRKRVVYNKRPSHYTAMAVAKSVDAIPIELQIHPSTVASSDRPNATNDLPGWLMTNLRICQITAWLMLIGGPVAMAFGGVIRDDLLNEYVSIPGPIRIAKLIESSSF